MLYFWGFLICKIDSSHLKIIALNALWTKFQHLNEIEIIYNKTYVIFIKMFVQKILHIPGYQLPCFQIDYLLTLSNDCITSYSCYIMWNERLIKSVMMWCSRGKNKNTERLFMDIRTNQPEPRGSVSILFRGKAWAVREN